MFFAFSIESISIFIVILIFSGYIFEKIFYGCYILFYRS